jgi:hypothetical protein
MPLFPQVTANNWESGLFICFLVIFALIAAGYVLKKVGFSSRPCWLPSNLI